MHSSINDFRFREIARNLAQEDNLLEIKKNFPLHAKLCKKCNFSWTYYIWYFTFSAKSCIKRWKIKYEAIKKVFKEKKSEIFSFSHESFIVHKLKVRLEGIQNFFRIQWMWFSSGNNHQHHIRTSSHETSKKIIRKCISSHFSRDFFVRNKIIQLVYF